MISHMTVENFKALRRVDVDLGPFTVLIGPNDSGKSSFLEAVFALSESARSDLPRCFVSSWQGAELVYGQSFQTPVKLQAHLAQAESSPATSRAQTISQTVYGLNLSFEPGRQCRVSDELIRRRG